MGFEEIGEERVGVDEGGLAEGVQGGEICRTHASVWFEFDTDGCVPWKHPGLQTGISTINSALSFSQLPARLPPKLADFLPSSPTATFPPLAFIDNFSTMNTTSSPNSLVSPSTSLTVRPAHC